MRVTGNGPTEWERACFHVGVFVGAVTGGVVAAIFTVVLLILYAVITRAFS